MTSLPDSHTTHFHRKLRPSVVVGECLSIMVSIMVASFSAVGVTTKNNEYGTFSTSTGIQYRSISSFRKYRQKLFVSSVKNTSIIFSLRYLHIYFFIRFRFSRPET